jgi:hypothetical protein
VGCAICRTERTNRIHLAATEAGGKIVAGPMEVPGGDLIAIGMDPQGAAFAVHSAAAATAKTKEPATAGHR